MSITGSIYNTSVISIINRHRRSHHNDPCLDRDDGHAPGPQFRHAVVKERSWSVGLISQFKLWRRPALPFSLFTSSLLPSRAMLSFELEPERQETVAAYWRRHHRWLASKGYVLRTSLRASWTPSGDLDLDPRYLQVRHFCLSLWEFPDLSLQRGVVIDATRASDGMYVALKRVRLDRASAEADLAQYFQALNGQSLRNHCAPILDILPVDGEERDVILVMPLLKEFDKPPFKTFGEVIAFLSQIFEVRVCAHTLPSESRRADCLHLSGLGVHARYCQHHAWVSNRRARVTSLYILILFVANASPGIS